MAFLRAKPIGVMGMIDQGEQDDKVCVRSAAWADCDTAVAAVSLQYLALAAFHVHHTPNLVQA